MDIMKGLCSKWAYFIRTIPEASGFFAPLEEGLSRTFIPVLTNRSINRQERAQFAWLGGLGFRNFLECSDDEFAASLKGGSSFRGSDTLPAAYF